MATASPVAELDSPPITNAKPTPRRWPALVLVALGIGSTQLPYLYQAAPEVVPAMPTFMASMWGPAVATLVLCVWWLIRGSAPLRMRLASLGVGALVATGAFLAAHPSARFFVLTKAIPATAGILVVFLCLAWRLPLRLRLGLVGVLAGLSLLPWELMQFNGVTGQFGMDPQWRWRPNPEELAASYDQNKKVEAPAVEAPMSAGATDWPGFRGPRQDGTVTGINLGDWQTPPKERWRRPVGRGWSSFCIIGDRLFTQEQRGEEELVVCYAASTGAQLWATGDPVRYSDQPSGVGPRGTPTFHDGKIYTLGGTAILNCLDAASGKRLWRVDLKEAVGATPSPFGFASSPLAVGDRIIVHPGSPTGPRLVAYHARTGDQLWTAGKAAVGYSSPHLGTLAGVEQVLVYSGDGLFGHDPISGKELWAYEWKAEMTAPVCVQPMLLPGDRVVLGGGRPGVKSRCVKLVRKDETWSVEDIWESPFTPAFNDYVRIGEFIYGLESGRLVCLEASTGKRRWKEGNYGAGQVLLAGERLLVLAESGRLALVYPMPDSWQQLSIFDAMSEKTWNHPVIANGKLFVRNGEEMVCYDLEK